MLAPSKNTARLCSDSRILARQRSLQRGRCPGFSAGGAGAALARPHRPGERRAARPVAASEGARAVVGAASVSVEQSPRGPEQARRRPGCWERAGQNFSLIFLVVLKTLNVFQFVLGKERNVL